MTFEVRPDSLCVVQTVSMFPTPDLAPAVFDPARLEAVRRTGLFDPSPDAAFDRAVRLAQRLLGVPVVHVSVVGSEWQVHKAQVGLPAAVASGMPLAHSFCTHVVASGAPVAVADARGDARVRDNPSIAAFGVGAYFGVPVRSPDGQVVGSLCGLDMCPRAWTPADEATLRDLAATVEAEIALRAELADRDRAEMQDRASRVQADRLALVAARTTNGVVVTDAEGRTEWVNEGFTRISGYTLDDLAGRKPGHVLQGPGTDPATVEALHGRMHGREPFAFEILNYHKDGTPYWIQVEVTPLVEDDGTLSGFMAIETDVTERRRAETALRESEAQYRLLSETASDVIVTVDDEYRIVYVNPAVREVFGYEPGALVGQDLFAFMPPRLRAASDAARERHRASGAALATPRAVEVPGLRRDGSEIVIAGTFSDYDHGGRRFTTGVMRDVSAQRAAEAALRASEAQYRSVVESVRDAVLQTDAEGRWTFLNPAWEAITGYTVGESLGRRSTEFFHADEATVHEAHFQRLVAGETDFARFESRIVTRAGELRHVELHVLLARDAAGAVVGTTGTVSDVTDSVRFVAEREARERAEEMARLKSAFLNNMSHELRTPLTGILGFAEVLADEVPEHLRADVETILRGAQRLHETLNSVLDLAQIESGTVALRPERLDVLAEAEDALAVLGSLARARSLALSVSGAPAAVVADRPALHRVLFNLVGNALKFTEAGGVSVRVEAEAGAVRLRVSDTGIGIDAAFLPRLFDEFTQASEGYARTHEGNGLGLPITKRLVDLMGGEIAVESAPGQGTTFTVTFAEAPTEAPTEAPPAEAPRAGMPVWRPVAEAAGAAALP